MTSAGRDQADGAVDPAGLTAVGGFEMPHWRFPVERTEHGAMMVRGAVSDYVIEPIRFELGLSRVEMVDEYLRGRTGEVWRGSADTDALLAARLQFEDEGE